MTTPGPICLLGGGEHRAGCEPVDRWLMERTGRDRVRVTVIPAASTEAMLPATAALARNYWMGLGAEVTVAVPGGPVSSQMAALVDPDIIVLTGGVPGRLVRTLGASPVWERALDLWHGGTAISGSSAGAMALFTWRFALRAPHPLRVVPALGPLRGLVCVPHFDRVVRPLPVLHPWVRRAARGLRELSILGLDEATALIVDGDHCEVRGRGSVTVIDGDNWRTTATGAAVNVGRRLAVTPADLAVAA